MRESAAMPVSSEPPALPPGLPQYFPVRDAPALGLARAQVDARSLDASIWGVRSPEQIEGLRAKAGALLARLPSDAFISHSSALALYEVPIPGRLEEDDRVDIALPAPARGPHARGIRGHRLAIREGDVLELGGIRVAAPARAWVDAAMQLSLGELVAAGDVLARIRNPIAPLQQLAARVADHPLHLAGGRLHRGLALIDGRAESYPESLLRVLLVEAGFPRPVVNEPMRIAGRVRRPDLAYPRQRVLIEYQGDHHRERGQWLRDLRRRSEFEAEGFTVIEVTWQDVLDPSHLFRRLRALGVG